MCPLPLRKIAWERLARDLDRAKLSEMTHEIDIGQVIAMGAQILAGQVRGRVVVKIV
jgi:acrylyl-CoA reductase (NADPH)